MPLFMDIHENLPGATAKDKENRRIPFNPKGRLAAILTRRAALGPEAFVFGTPGGEFQPNIQATTGVSDSVIANCLRSRSTCGSVSKSVHVKRMRFLARKSRTIGSGV